MAKEYFAETHVELDKAKVVILPIPYDRTTTYVSGTRNGPQAIISASKHLEFYDQEIKKDIRAIGIHTLDEMEPLASGPLDMINAVEEIVQDLISKDKFIIMIGGEHSLSLGVIKPIKETYPYLSVLYLDAHADLRESYEGSPYSHACAARRIAEVAPIVLVGIRSISEKEAIYAEQEKLKLISMYDIVKDSVNVESTHYWQNKVIDYLSDDVYISIDLDVLDPSLMPAVGNPVPGGFFWYDILSFLKKIVKRKKIRGFDVVELCPIPSSKAPDFTAAKLIYKVLGYILSTESKYEV
jgi:agmatinase